jgi:hypothetical protein
MNFQVGKCYRVLLHGQEKRFRIVKNENHYMTVRHCGSGVEEPLNHILMGDISDIEVNEFDCMECDGKATVPSF